MSTNKAGFKRLVTIRTGSVRFEARVASKNGDGLYEQVRWAEERSECSV
jgi:hypothetical protein